MAVQLISNLGRPKLALLSYPVLDDALYLSRHFQHATSARKINLVN